MMEGDGKYKLTTRSRGRQRSAQRELMDQLGKPA